MRALPLLLATVAALWCGQNLLLRHAGLPMRWRIGPGDLPARHRHANRFLTNCILAGTLLLYPILVNTSPLDYYLKLFPGGRQPGELIWGLAAATLYLLALFLAWTLSDNVRFRARRRPLQIARRLAGVPLTAGLAALLEELLFRGVLLADLQTTLSTPPAVILAAFIFAAAHYLRPVKRYWTFPGHVGLGMLLCLAFVWSGSLWLPVGLHAGGVLVLMGIRPLIRYTGPAWLVGASIFPYAGGAGLIGLALLTLNIWRRYCGVG